MGTDPLVLKSKTAEIKCTYERPFKFLPGLRKGEPYEVMNPLDVNPDCIQVNGKAIVIFRLSHAVLRSIPLLFGRQASPNPENHHYRAKYLWVAHC